MLAGSFWTRSRKNALVSLVRTVRHNETSKRSTKEDIFRLFVYMLVKERHFVEADQGYWRQMALDMHDRETWHLEEVEWMSHNCLLVALTVYLLCSLLTWSVIKTVALFKHNTKIFCMFEVSFCIWDLCRRSLFNSCHGRVVTWQEICCMRVAAVHRTSMWWGSENLCVPLLCPSGTSVWFPPQNHTAVLDVIFFKC